MTVLHSVQEVKDGEGKHQDYSEDKAHLRWNLLDKWKALNYEQSVLQHKFDPFIRIYCEGEPKPSWRGILHYIPVLLFSACIYPLLMECETTLQTQAVVGWCVINVYTFMCSVILHTWHLNPLQEIFVQKCDHAGVFLNASMHTTQYIFFALESTWYRNHLLCLTWMTSIWGITLIILKKKRNYHTAFCPIGLIVSLPLLHSAFTAEQWTCLLITWLCLTLGLVLFVTQKPIGWPETFGYHEYFHLLTVIATFTSIRLEFMLVDDSNH